MKIWKRIVVYLYILSLLINIGEPFVVFADTNEPPVVEVDNTVVVENIDQNNENSEVDVSGNNEEETVINENQDVEIPAQEEKETAEEIVEEKQEDATEETVIEEEQSIESEEKTEEQIVNETIVEDTNENENINNEETQNEVIEETVEDNNEPEPTYPIIIDEGKTYEHNVQEVIRTINIKSYIVDNEDTDLSNISMLKDEVVELSLEKENIEDIRWQIKIPNTDIFVNIENEMSAKIRLNYATIASLLDKENKAVVRARYSLEGEDFTSPEVTLRLEKPKQNTIKKAPAKGPEKGGDAETYNIVVNFVFNDGSIARDPIIATVAAGDNYSQVISIEQFVGYESYIDNDETPSTQLNINLTNINENHTYYITYRPALVNYRVEHYFQNTVGDGYYLYEVENKQGYSGDLVEECDNIYSGMYALLYDLPVIAADGSTTVAVFYDRFYYLIDFDTQGGTGADPIYARYDSDLTTPIPTKKGYEFVRWEPTVPSKIPVGGGTYTAIWNPVETTYTVLYWYENTTGTDKYSVVGSSDRTAVSETVVNADDYQNDSFDDRDDVHFVYNTAKSQDYTINGDGTTVVNVYFDRKIVNFNFHFEDDEYDVYTISGRYGSSFSSNGVAWPSKYDWYFTNTSGGKNWMTFMDGFIPTSSMPDQFNVDFYHDIKSGNKIYFLKEKDDGTFIDWMDPDVLEAEADNIVTATANGNFTFSEKYEGYTIQDYQTSGTNYRYSYTKNGQTIHYTGKRFVTTTSDSGEQYGIIDGELVKLKYVSSGDTIWQLPYTYTSTTANTGTQYGIIRGEYYLADNEVALSFEDGEKYTGTYVYAATNPTSGNMYGVVNGNVVEVTNGYYYTHNEGNQPAYTGSYYYTETTANNGTQYGVVDGEVAQLYISNGYVYEEDLFTNSSKTDYYWNGTAFARGTIYYHDGKYYRTRSGWWGNYTYSNEVTPYARTRSNGYHFYGKPDEEYTGTRYTRSASSTSTYSNGFVNGEMIRINRGYVAGGQRYTGTRYTRTNAENAQDGTQYYAPDNGEMRPLQFSSTWTINGQPYTGTRYTRTTSNTEYTGSRYTREGNAAPYTYTRTESEEGTQYGIDANGGHQQLNKTINNWNGWFPADTSVYSYEDRYEGTRYIESTATNGVSGFDEEDGVMRTLTRTSYTGFGETWTKANVGSTVSTSNNVIIRYVRKNYDVEYYNYNYYMDSQKKTAHYQQSLAEGYDFVPEYPYDLPYGAYEFVGWYDNQELLGEPFDFNTNMPANNIVLFAKYQPKKYRARIYKDLTSMINDTNKVAEHVVDYGSLIPTPPVPDNGRFTFVGWFYQNRYGEELPFQFSTTTVTSNFDIYAKWSSDTLVTYEVKFETEDGQTVADPIHSSALEGSTKTFFAEDTLYPQFAEGYFPTVSSHSMLFDADIDNTYTFVYKHYDSVPYVVRYIDETTGESLLPDKVVDDNRRISVTEKFVNIQDYRPDKFRKTLVVSAENPETNYIIFYYTKDTDHAIYQTIHYVEQDDGTWKIYNALDTLEVRGVTVQADPIQIPGYTYDPTVEGTVTSGVVTAEGLELKLYYKQNRYPYKVRYLEDKTYRVLAPEKIGEGKFNGKVTEDSIDIPNYICITSSPQTITITQETDANNIVSNVITFFYRVDQAEYKYNYVYDNTTEFIDNEFVAAHTGTPEGHTPVLEGYDFAGWFLDEDCTIPVDSALVDATTNKLTPAKETVGEDEKYVSHNYYAKFTPSGADFKITNAVEGNMGSRVKRFNYTITLDGYANETITIVKPDGTEEDITLDENGSFTTTLSHGEEIVLKMVRNNTNITISEQNDDYQTRHTYDSTEHTGASLTLSSSYEQVDFVNRRNVAVPTEIRYDFTSGIVILLIAVFYWVLRKESSPEFETSNGAPIGNTAEINNIFSVEEGDSIHKDVSSHRLE